MGASYSSLTLLYVAQNSAQHSNLKFYPQASGFHHRRLKISGVDLGFSEGGC